jgi:hypothetical protein
MNASDWLIEGAKFSSVLLPIIFISVGLNAPPSSWITIPEDRGSRVLVAVESFLYAVTNDVVKLVSHALLVSFMYLYY